MHRQLYWVGVAGGVLGCGGAWAWGTEQALVDFSVTGAAMTHRASGFLHSIDPSNPPDALVAPLKPQMLRMRPDAAMAMDARASALGVQHMQIIVSDGFNPEYDGAYPGDGGNWAPWDTYVTNLATRVASNAVPVQFDVWNEPDISAFWKRDKPTFLEAWRRAVLDIRAVNPAAEIVGPSFSNYANGTIGMQDFLLYAKNNNVLPDVLSWHEFGGSFVSRVADVRSFMAASAIDVSRISINEIVGTGSLAGGQLWESAGPLARYFSDAERAGLESMAHACWDEPNAPGVNNGENDSLDGLLTPDTKQPRSTYWMYERYGEMAGTVSGFTAGVVKNGSGGVTFDGLSTKGDGVAQVLIGRFQPDGGQLDSSPVEVRLTNLDQVPDLVVDGQVLVTAERIADSQLAASSGPTVVFSQVMDVVGGQLVVPIGQFGSTDGYFLTLSAVAPSGPVSTWVKDTGGAWWDEFAWSEGTPPDGAGVSARLGAGEVGVRTIYVDTAWTLGRLIMDDPAGYDVVGSAQLIMDNNASRGLIQVNAGVNEIAVRVQPGIEGTPPDVTVANGATLRIGGVNRLKVATVNLGASGTLDLGGNDMLVEDDRTTAAVTADRVRQMIQAGYHGGAWDGAGLRSDAISAGSGMALGYAAATLIGLEEFEGQPVRPMAVLIMHTIAGDANLDGRLNGDDYALLDRALAKHLSNAHWTDGDFNYDGVVDAGDYLVIDAAWVRQTGVLSPSMLAEREARFGSDYVAELVAVVPEPGGVVVVVTIVPWVLARRVRLRSGA